MIVVPVRRLTRREKYFFSAVCVSLAGFVFGSLCGLVFGYGYVGRVVEGYLAFCERSLLLSSLLFGPLLVFLCMASGYSLFGAGGCYAVLFFSLCHVGMRCLYAYGVYGTKGVWYVTALILPCVAVRTLLLWLEATEALDFSSSMRAMPPEIFAAELRSYTRLGLLLTVLCGTCVLWQFKVDPLLVKMVEPYLA